MGLHMLDIKMGTLDFIIIFVQGYGYFIKHEPQLVKVIKVDMIDVPLYVDDTMLFLESCVDPR